MYEHVELIGLAQFETQRAKAALGIMPEQANKMINFLNHQTREELATLQIMNRTEAILIAKKFLTLRMFCANSRSKMQGNAKGCRQF